MSLGESGGPGAPAATRGSGVRAVLPDLLTGSRIVLGPLFVLALPLSAWGALALALLAALTDFLDGRLARRWGTGSARGAVLDVVGDGVFVLSGLAGLAWLGILSPALPVATAVSLLALMRAWKHRSVGTSTQPVRRLPDRMGHLAGILNYGAVCVGAGFMALQIPLDLIWASRLVALLNLLPILLRWVDRPVAPADR